MSLSLEDFLTERDIKTGETWLEFCRKRDFTVEEMLSGRRFKQHFEATRPDKPTEACTSSVPDTPDRTDPLPQGRKSELVVALRR